MRTVIHVAIASIVPLAGTVSAQSASAGQPVALVENIQSRTAGVDFMDYLVAGRKIHLSPSDRLIVGYLQSCWRETIAGGTVTIGNEKSTVFGGKITRTRVPCGRGHVQLTAGTAQRSGALVKRGFRKQTQVVYGLPPVLELRSTGRLRLERLDRLERPREFQIRPEHLIAGSFLDFGKMPAKWRAGGRYRVSLGADSLDFRVHQDARFETSAVISRLVRMPRRR